MKISDVRDYLKQNIACEHWYVGKIDRNQEYCIGIYPTAPVSPVIAIGGVQNSSYTTKAVSVLVHWGKAFTPAEEKAQEIYDLLFGQSPITGGKRVIKMDFRTAEPIGIGTDEQGVFEYVINFIIYYQKG